MAQRVFSFHYVLTNKEGQTIDSSRSAEPFPVFEGSNHILPGLGEELFKMNVGDKKKVSLAADKAYGPVRENLKMTVPRTKLPEGEIKAGTQFRGGPGQNDPIFTVIHIEGDNIHLDGNHPLAGQDLTFDIEVTEIREATKEELEHGHAHGPNGHHNH